MKQTAKEYKYLHNDKVVTAKMIRYNDAFYRITEGKYKYNLVHIFDIIS